MFQTIRIRLTAMLVLLYLILYLVSSTVIYALTSQLSIGNLDAILKETADPLAAQIAANGLNGCTQILACQPFALRVELLSQDMNVRLHDVAVHVIVKPPHAIKQSILGENPPRIAHKKFHQLKLALRQFERIAAKRDATLNEIK